MSNTNHNILIESFEDEDSDVDLENLPRHAIWKSENKSCEKPKENVLKIPHKVIRNSLHKSHRRVKLVDSSTGNSYGCELCVVERKYYVESFSDDGWNDFVRDTRLKNGDRVRYRISDPPPPPGEKIVITVLKSRIILLPRKCMGVGA
ncbi:hypothetical protein RYX36_018847 [Vicia faba]